VRQATRERFDWAWTMSIRLVDGEGCCLVSWIATQFGTLRGAVRLTLSYGQVAAGATPRNIEWTKIDRLVFVCRGNI
jgi:hypothetical protein